MNAQRLRGLTSGLILGITAALLIAEGSSVIALGSLASGSFWLLGLWLPRPRWVALSSAGFALLVLLVALWVWVERSGALGGLLIGLTVAAWQLEQLANRWGNMPINSEAKAVLRHELKQWKLLSTVGIGLALVGALGTVSLNFPLALVLLTVMAWCFRTALLQATCSAPIEEARHEES